MSAFAIHSPYSRLKNINATRLLRYVAAIGGTSFKALDDKDRLFSFITQKGTTFSIRVFSLQKDNDRFRMLSNGDKFKELCPDHYSIGVAWNNASCSNALDDIPFALIHPCQVNSKSIMVPHTISSYYDVASSIKIATEVLEENRITLTAAVKGLMSLGC